MALSTGRNGQDGLAQAVAEGGGAYLQQLYWNQQAGQHPSDYTWTEGADGITRATPNWTILAQAGLGAPDAAPNAGGGAAPGSYTPTSWVTQVLNDAGLPATPNNINSMLHWLPTEEPSSNWAHANNPLNINAHGAGYDTFPNLATAAAETARYLNMPNYRGIHGVLQNNGSLADFSAAVVASPWASSHYGGNPMHIAQTSIGNGGAVVNNGGPAGMATSSTMTTADWASLNSLAQAGLTATDVQELASSHTNTGQIAGSPAGTLADIVSSILGPYGLDTPTIEQWVNQQITQFAAMNMSTTQIGEQIGIELQQPVGSSKDPLTTAAQQAFSNKYPGMAIRAQNGLPPITVAQYQSLQDSYYQTASAAGITPAMLNGVAIGAGGQPGDAVGILIGNDVSAQEFGTRIQNGYNAATNADPETLKLLQHYYPSVFPQGANGSAPTSGALLSYYLDPTHTVTALENQITAAQIGTEGVNSQFGGIPVAQAQKLQQAGVTQSTARTTFNSLAKLTPFETTLPGTQSPNAMLTQGQLVDYGFFGANQQLLENVQSNRKAPFEGGGGYAATPKGIVGAGGASTEGIQGT